MKNDEWNIDPRRWKKRCLLTRGDHIKKNYLISKIKKLNDWINQDLMKDPVENLKSKWGRKFKVQKTSKQSHQTNEKKAGSRGPVV